MVGVPIVVMLLPITWLVLTRIAFRVSAPHERLQIDILEAETAALGPISRGEILVSIVIILTALGWVFRPLIVKLYPGLALSDAGIAIMAAVLLFVIPARSAKGQFLLSWSEAIKLRWDVLILFGGGLTLAAAMAESGLVNAIAAALSILNTLPLIWLVLIVMIVVVYLGELASNTAMAAIFLPISAAIAGSVGADPMLLVLPVTLAASLGFMLPVATPPNAIIFGGGAVTGRQMLKAGAILDVLCIAVTAAVCVTLGYWALGSANA